MMGQLRGTPTWPLADHWCFKVLRLQPATMVCHHFPYCLMYISYWLEDLRREWRMIRRYLDIHSNYWHSSHSPIPYSSPVRFDGVFHKKISPDLAPEVHGAAGGRVWWCLCAEYQWGIGLLAGGDWGDWGRLGPAGSWTQLIYVDINNYYQYTGTLFNIMYYYICYYH